MFLSTFLCFFSVLGQGKKTGAREASIYSCWQPQSRKFLKNPMPSCPRLHFAQRSKLQRCGPRPSFLKIIFLRERIILFLFLFKCYLYIVILYFDSCRNSTNGNEKYKYFNFFWIFFFSILQILISYSYEAVYFWVTNNITIRFHY